MNIYDFTVKDADGNDVNLGVYKGKVLLIVNTASKCGLTPQYEELQKIYDELNPKGLEILDFPCNQFLNQAPGTDKEQEEFCQLNYGTKFKTFAKIDVNGDNAAPLYKALKKAFKEDTADESHAPFIEKIKNFIQEKLSEDIKWNFTKFLVDRDGNVVERFSPTYSMEKLKEAIEKQI